MENTKKEDVVLTTFIIGAIALLVGVGIGFVTTNFDMGRVSSIEAGIGGGPPTGVTGVNVVTDQENDISKIVSQWPDNPRERALQFMADYDLPSEYTPSHLIWYNNDIWTKSVIYRDEISHDFPVRHTDYLEQTLKFSVPADKQDEIAAFDGSVLVDRTKGEVTVRSDMEEMNILMFNLLYDIITDRRSVEDARAEYARSAAAYREGQSSEAPLTSGLQFVPPSNTSDPDQQAEN